MLRYLHERLVLGKWSATAASTNSIGIGVDVLDLAGDAVVNPHRPAQSTASLTTDEILSLEVTGVTGDSTRPSSERSSGRVVESSPLSTSTHKARVGATPSLLPETVQFLGKRRVACRLPQNWPGLALDVMPRMLAPLGARQVAADTLMRRSEVGGGGPRCDEPTPTATESRAEGVDGAGEVGVVSAAMGSPVGPPRHATATTATVASRQQRQINRRRQFSPPPKQFTRPPPKQPALSAPRELYLLFDERNFVLAAPEPKSVENGRVVCIAPLRHTVSRPHPADPRVIELRVSTREAGGSGPGLFLPIASAAAPWSRDEQAGGASFRGYGHRGLWHLVSRETLYANRK